MKDRLKFEDADALADLVLKAFSSLDLVAPRLDVNGLPALSRTAEDAMASASEGEIVEFHIMDTDTGIELSYSLEEETYDVVRVVDHPGTREDPPDSDVYDVRVGVEDGQDAIEEFVAHVLLRRAIDGHDEKAMTGLAEELYPTKYYIGKLKILEGEREYTSTHTFSIPAEDDPNLVMDRRAKYFYGEPDVARPGESYCFFGGAVAVEVKGFQKITPEEYTMLRRIGI